MKNKGLKRSELEIGKVYRDVLSKRDMLVIVNEELDMGKRQPKKRRTIAKIYIREGIEVKRTKRNNNMYFRDEQTFEGMEFYEEIEIHDGQLAEL